MAQPLTAHKMLFGVGEQALTRFQESLAPDDRQALDGLLDSAQVNSLAVAQAGPALPVELLLLALLVEQQKTIQFLIGRLNYYDQKMYFKKVKRSPDPARKPLEY